jgi:hypothetical protein
LQRRVYCRSVRPSWLLSGKGACLFGVFFCIDYHQIQKEILYTVFHENGSRKFRKFGIWVVEVTEWKSSITFHSMLGQFPHYHICVGFVRKGGRRLHLSSMFCIIKGCIFFPLFGLTNPTQLFPIWSVTCILFKNTYSYIFIYCVHVYENILCLFHHCQYSIRDIMNVWWKLI